MGEYMYFVSYRINTNDVGEGYSIIKTKQKLISKNAEETFEEFKRMIAMDIQEGTGKSVCKDNIFILNWQLIPNF